MEYKHKLQINLYDFQTNWGRTWDEITSIQGDAPVELITTTTTRRISDGYQRTTLLYASAEKFFIGVVRHITGNKPELDSDSEGCYESEPIGIKQKAFRGEDVDQDELDKAMEMFNY